MELPEDDRDDAEESSEPQHRNQVVFLPSKVAAAAGGKASKTRQTPGGRFSRPTREDQERYDAEKEDRQRFIDSDPIVVKSSGKDPLALLGVLKQEVAREAAALLYQRIENEKMGKDISQVSSRRIDAIKKIADIEMEMRKIGFNSIDVRSEPIQKLFKFWIDTILAAAAETLQAEQLDLFSNRITTDLDDWESKVADLLR